ncbi:MAG: TIGR03960 family B12-binding radical SAM protein, partial [Lachnospiraceae bacterium]|nr:TIGR03960 family B12-binding radical SAM protein [Lachnospiraceae bacterium]
IVIGGGPCVYNPEPIADFFDLFYIGEGETVYNQLLDLYKSMKADGSYRRAEYLHEASKIPGIYVPSLYDVAYNEDGTIASFTPVYEDVPKKVKRQVVMDLDASPYPMKPVVPYVRATQDRVVLEIQRGCIRGCRFCQAGMIYRPNREKSLDVLRDYAIQMLENTGYDEISLSSLSSSDYTQIEDLVNFLIEECNKRKINISLPSLRIDSFSLDVMSKVQDINKSSLTFAPEAGSQRMRNTINKGLTEEDIMNGAELAFQGGWNKVKFYFMLGLPGEEEEDMRAIPELSNRVAALYYDTVPKEKRHGKCQITMSTSFFVPKPWTPFQWARMYEPNEYLRRAKIVNDTMKEQLNHKSLSYQWHQADVTVLEGIFARGDRKLSKAIAYAYEQGCFFDAWGEYFDYQKWLDAFAACGIDPDFYTMREREITEILPWDFIDTGIRREFLEHEWEQAKAKVVTPNCKMRCSGCGCKSFGGGICYEG